MTTKRSSCLVVGVALIFVVATGARAQEAMTPEAFCREVAPIERAACEAAGELLTRPPDPDLPDLALYLTATAGELKLRYASAASSTGDDRECLSRGTIALPAGQAVRLVVTAGDAIHTLRVPAGRIAVDLVPGRINEVSIAGETRDGDVWPGTLEQYAEPAMPVALRFLTSPDGEGFEALCRASASAP